MDWKVFLLAHSAGFEPTTPAFGGQYSIQLSYECGHRDPGGHVGQAEGHRLVLDQGFTEALPLVGIVAGHFERGAGHAHRLRGDTDAPTFQVGQGDLVALPFFAQAVGHWHTHVVETIWQVSEACWPSLSSTRATW